MRAAALAVALTALGASAPFAYGHCYSIWKNPWPQHCGVKSPPHNWFVEIVTPPPKPAEPTQDEKDRQEHDAAVAAHHDELNTLLQLLQVREGNPGAWK